jgi:hypothetical protein
MQLQKFINLFQFKNNIQENILKKEVSSLIQKGFFSFVFNYIQKGYQLTEKQELMLLKNIKHPEMIAISQNTDIMTHLDVKYQALFFFAGSQEKKLEELLGQQINNKNFQNAFQKYWFLLFQDYKKQKKYEGKSYYPGIEVNHQWIHVLQKYPSIIFQNQNNQEVFHWVVEIANLYSYEKNARLNNFSINYLEDFSEAIVALKKYSLSLVKKNIQFDVQKYKNGIENKMAENIQSFKIENTISSDIQTKLDQLNTLYLEMNQEELNQEQRFQMKNLFEKKIPETIEKYLSIDPEYRKELKNFKGQNAEEIMLSSLEEIMKKFIEVKKEKNENNLQDLTIKQHYFKEVKI